MIATEMLDENCFGPIENLIRDETVSEIMVNGPKQVYVEKNGKIVLTDVVSR